MAKVKQASTYACYGKKMEAWECMGPAYLMYGALDLFFIKKSPTHMAICALDVNGTLSRCNGKLYLAHLIFYNCI